MIHKITRIQKDNLSGSEAIFRFAAWLTCRKQPIYMGLTTHVQILFLS